MIAGLAMTFSILKQIIMKEVKNNSDYNIQIQEMKETKKFTAM